MYLRLLYFSILWIKIPDGYQMAGLEELGLWSTSQSSLWISESSPEDWSQLSAVLYSEVIFLLIIRYVMSIVF